MRVCFEEYTRRVQNDRLQYTIRNRRKKTVFTEQAVLDSCTVEHATDRSVVIDRLKGQ